MKQQLTVLRDYMNDYMIRPKGMFIWRDIPGFEGRYQISNHGEVCSITNKMLRHGSQVLLTGIDKSRQYLSVNKLLKGYWKEDERNTGEEQWKKIDHFQHYYISNYGNVKNCKRLILWPTKHGCVKLWGVDGDRKKGKVVSVLTIFLQSFTAEEIFIDHEKKEVNYVKKNENIANTTIKKSA